MSAIPDECPDCGHGEIGLVKYTPDADPMQMEFAKRSPPLYTATCMECGYVATAVVDESGNGEDGQEEETDSSEYRVDETLR